MDFDLFMERYGYKLIGIIIVAVMVIILGVPILGLLVLFKRAPQLFAIIFGAAIGIALLLKIRFPGYREYLGKYYVENKERR